MEHHYLYSYAFSIYVTVSFPLSFSLKLSIISVLHWPKEEKRTLSVNHDELRHKSLKMFVNILIQIKINIVN